MYAISAWYGFLNKIVFLNVLSSIDMSNLLSSLNSYCKIRMITKATQGNHAMHHLLPSPKSTCYNLRTLGHRLSINPVKSELHKNTFTSRLIFDDCY